MAPSDPGTPGFFFSFSFWGFFFFGFLVFFFFLFLHSWCRCCLLRCLQDPNPNNLVACCTLYTEALPPVLLLVRALAPHGTPELRAAAAASALTPCFLLHRLQGPPGLAKPRWLGPSQGMSVHCAALLTLLPRVRAASLCWCSWCCRFAWADPSDRTQMPPHSGLP